MAAEASATTMAGLEASVNAGGSRKDVEQPPPEEATICGETAAGQKQDLIPMDEGDSKEENTEMRQASCNGIDSTGAADTFGLDMSFVTAESSQCSSPHANNFVEMVVASNCVERPAASGSIWEPVTTNSIESVAEPVTTDDREEPKAASIMQMSNDVKPEPLTSNSIETSNRVAEFMTSNSIEGFVASKNIVEPMTIVKTEELVDSNSRALTSICLGKPAACESMVETMTSVSIELVAGDSIEVLVASNSLAEPVIMDSIVEPVASDSIVKPASSNSIEEPAASDSMVNPASSNSIEEPAASDSMVKPASSNSVEEPAASDSMVKPASSNSIEEAAASDSITKSTASSSIEDIAAGKSMEVTATNNGTEEPLTSDSMDSIAANDMEEQLASESMEVLAVSGGMEDLQAGQSLAELVTSSRMEVTATNGSLASDSAMDTGTSNNMEEPVDVYSMEAIEMEASISVEESLAGSSVKKLATSKSAEVQMGDTSVVEPATSKSAEVPMGDSSVVEPAASKSAEGPMGDTSVMEPATSKSAERPMGDTSVVEPATSKRGEGPMGDTSVVEPATSKRAEILMGDTSVVEPATSKSTEGPMGDTSVVEPATSKSTEGPMGDTSVVEPATSKSAEGPMGDTSVVELSTSKSPEGPMGDTSVVEPATSKSPEGPMGDTSVVEPAISKSPEGPMGDTSVVEPATSKSPEGPMGDTSVVEPATSKSAEGPMGDTSVVEPATSKSAERTITDTGVEPTLSKFIEGHIAITDVVEPVMNDHVEGSIADTDVVEPVMSDHVEGSIADSRVVEPVTSKTADRLITNTGIVQPSTTKIGAGPIVDNNVVEPAPRKITEGLIAYSGVVEPAVNKIGAGPIEDSSVVELAHSDSVQGPRTDNMEMATTNNSMLVAVTDSSMMELAPTDSVKVPIGDSVERLLVGSMVDPATLSSMVRPLEGGNMEKAATSQSMKEPATSDSIVMLATGENEGLPVGGSEEKLGTSDSMAGSSADDVERQPASDSAAMMAAKVGVEALGVGNSMEVTVTIDGMAGPTANLYQAEELAAVNNVQQGAILPFPPEFEKYWKAAMENPCDFAVWTELLQYVEQENDIYAVRRAFDAFLSHYPYCYGYWKKYADLERRFDCLQESGEVFERGLQATPLSLDLWIHFITFLQDTLDMNASESILKIRSIFESAVAAAGMDFRSDKLWQMYVTWEREQGNLRAVTTIYDRVLSVPTQLYSHQFEMFKEHVMSNSPRDIVSVEEIQWLKSKIISETAQENEGKVAVDAVTGEELPPGVELAAEEDSLLEKHADKLRELIIAIREQIYTQNEMEVSKRWSFEEGIKRPYFHVKPLERAQLKNWHDYLDFEMANGSHERCIVLFERCVIACALYEDFWVKYTKYLENHTVIGTRNVYQRACGYHLPRNPNLHLLWSAFEEKQGDIEESRRILEAFEEMVPGLVMVRLRRVSLERRQGELQAAEALLQEAVRNSQGTPLATFYTLKLARQVLKVQKNLIKARKILLEALEKEPENARLYMNLLEMEFSVDVKQNEINTINCIERALRSKLSCEVKVIFSQRRLEFLEDFGSSLNSLLMAYDEHQKLLKKQTTKKRVAANGNAEEPDSKKAKVDSMTVTGNTTVTVSAATTVGAATRAAAVAAMTNTVTAPAIPSLMSLMGGDMSNSQAMGAAAAAAYNYNPWYQNYGMYNYHNTWNYGQYYPQS
ncbi:uncharacterized protein LOC115097047 isoform X2 [Rhinatrema bivittatum]|uniref:uncharacterized protein LOC115097047 isoform X2 n=1 Tax=Rhinatrema bivittatum TaxID=194408 RepID=UPI001128BD8A|nr:uncharacterized protein LOC115097047 isoform X2 [Rhinatrema bivittatum]